MSESKPEKISDALSSGAIAFQGNWQGWENARLELVTVGTVAATVSCGYFKAKGMYSFDWETWDGRR